MDNKQRVVAHAMSEQELVRAQEIITDGHSTAAFVTGLVDQEQIKRLQNYGLIVENLGEVDIEGGPLYPAAPETAGTGARSLPSSPNVTRSRTFSTRHPHFDPKDLALPDLSRPNIYLVRIKGPLLPSYTSALGALSVVLLEAYGSDTYSAYLTPEQVDQANELGFVAEIALFDARHTIPGAGAPNGLESLGRASAAPGDQMPMLTYDVRLHRPEDLRVVRTWMDERHVPVAGAEGRKIRIYVLTGSPVLAELAALPEVERFEEFVPPKVRNDSARLLMKVDVMSGPTLPYDGTGQIVAVADTGLDDTHADFTGRIHTKMSLGRPGGRTDDPDGHGTHVAGSVLGDGSASAGTYKGTAPGAELYFQSLLDPSGRLGGLPLNLGGLFIDPYNAGARIHNNSWGADTRSTYPLNSEEVDEFVASHRDMLVVFAAGNEGKAANALQVGTGIVDWLSIGAPGTAKNALTVGASRSDTTAGGLVGRWDSFWPADFPDPWIAHQNVSDDPECMAAFSSRGPCDDRRIKPDVVAPGTKIVSTKSNIAPTSNYWGQVTGKPQYAYMGGTSMAAPLVSGCAALVRQYYVQEKDHEPSAALLRATLIAGTRWLKGLDANESNPSGVSKPAANYDQGFGCVNMITTLPNSEVPALGLAFIDTLRRANQDLSQTGDVRRYALRVTGSSLPLRICLCYTDVPGRGIQNNLNLFFQEPGPSGRKSVGNEGLRGAFKGPDSDNNVEVVEISTPSTGTYVVQVSARNLLRSPQDFALVALGELAGTMSPI